MMLRRTRPTSDLRARSPSSVPVNPPSSVLCCLRFSLWPLWRASAWVIVGHCCCLWFVCAAAILLARTCGTYAARLCCTFSTISVRCLWAECAFSVASVAHRHTQHTHTRASIHTLTQTHAELLTNSAIDWPRFMASIMKSCSSNCDKFDAKKKGNNKMPKSFASQFVKQRKHLNGNHPPSFSLPLPLSEPHSPSAYAHH